MSPLMFFVFIVTVAGVSYLLGYSVGQASKMNGRAVFNKKFRGEPP